MNQTTLSQTKGLDKTDPAGASSNSELKFAGDNSATVPPTPAAHRRTYPSADRCLTCGTVNDYCACCLRCTRCRKCPYWAGPIPAGETVTLARLQEIHGDLHTQQVKAVGTRRCVVESKRLKHETRIARAGEWDVVIADYDKRLAASLAQIRALLGALSTDETKFRATEVING